MASISTSVARREVTILKWRGCVKNTLLGFADVQLPSGIVIRGITLHQNGERRWLGLPARPYETDSGSTQRTLVVEIPDRETREQFERRCEDGGGGAEGVP